MKYIISYFSLTGNTRFVAERISAGIKAAEEDADVTTSDMQSVPESRVCEFYKDYDVLGFGSLTFGWDVPSLVIEHLQQIPDEDVSGKPCFFFITAQSSEGGAIPSMLNILRKKGAIPVAKIVIYAPDNFVPWIKVVPDDLKVSWPFEHWGKAHKFGRDIPKLVKEKKVVKARYPILAYGSWATMKFFDVMQLFVGKIEWNSDTCLGEGCSTCVNGCPWGALEFEDTDDGRVTLVRDPDLCASCTKCINCCPTKSLKRGRDDPKARGTFEFDSEMLVDVPFAAKGKHLLSKEDYDRYKVDADFDTKEK